MHHHQFYFGCYITFNLESCTAVALYTQLVHSLLNTCNLAAVLAILAAFFAVCITSYLYRNSHCIQFQKTILSSIQVSDYNVLKLE